jgi:ribosomal protein S18 acetylase RimI-like enzyme
MITLHELTSDDWSAWRDLRLAALSEAPYAFGSRFEDWEHADEARWRARLDAGLVNIAAELNGQAAGLVAAIDTDYEPNAIELISMWVAPFARGKGVGDALIRAIAAHGDRLGKKVILFVRDGNDAATALYRRNGFIPANKSHLGPGNQLEHMMVRA